MILVREAIKRNKIFKENGLSEVFKKVEEQEQLEKEHDHLLDLYLEKQNFINNFPRTKTFTTQKGLTITRKLYSFEADYPKSDVKTIIFTHGKTGYTIWFLNAKKKLCVIDKAVNKNGNIYLTVTIDVKGYKKQTNMTLDRFLSLVEKGDFTITLKKFVQVYLKDVTESNYYKNKIAEYDKKINEAKINFGYLV